MPTENDQIKAKGGLLLGSGEFLPAELESGVLKEIQIPGQREIQLKSHGAKWNGSTDDSSALQSAINECIELSGVPIVLPRGIGVINSEPEIPKNLGFQIPIIGCGKFNTYIKLTSAMRFLTFVATEPGDTIGNVNLSGFTVDGNNQLTIVAHGTSVIIGQKFTSAQQVNIEKIDITDVDTINVPPLTKKEGGRRNIELYSYHAEPGLPMNRIEKINIRRLSLEQGQSGVNLLGQGPTAPLPLNIRFRHILVEDIEHNITTGATETGYNANVQLAQNGWTDMPNTIVYQRISGKNSADVGAEFDCPCIFKDIDIADANNAAILINTFNPAVSEPIVTPTTALQTIGSTNIPVKSSTAFTVGKQIAFYGSGVSTSEVRVIKAKPDSEHIELTEATGIEWPSGTWMGQIDNQEGVRWSGKDIRTTRTKTLGGLNRGLVIQNAENVLPCPDIYIDGYTHNCTAKDAGSGGETLQIQTGTKNSPTGNPGRISIKGFKLARQNLEYSGSETFNYRPLNVIMRGPHARLDLNGEAIISGPANTGAGKLPAQIFREVQSAIEGDIDLTTKWIIGSSGGERWAGMSLGEAELSNFGGRVRHIARTSEIESGGGTQVGIRLGKACSFASYTVKTKLTEAMAATAISCKVESIKGFTVGEEIVIDSLSTTKSEIFTISGINEEEKKITVVQAGNAPGAVAEHASGATIALLNTVNIVDCNWRGLGTGGSDIGFEDTAVSVALRQRGNLLQFQPSAPPKVTLPASGKAFRMSALQKGDQGNFELTGGTVTAVEHSPNGGTYTKIALTTPCIFHVSPTDYIKLTWSVEPTAIFVADRN